MPRPSFAVQRRAFVGEDTMRKDCDYDLLEARAMIATLQRAFDRAQARIRELEHSAAVTNERLAAATERCDVLELHAIHLERERAAHVGAGAMQPRADLSP